MEKEALKMIAWGNNWSKFQDFIKNKETKAQMELSKELSLTTKDGEVIDIKIK
jgi:hypothetical protein